MKNGAVANVAEALQQYSERCKNTLTSPGPTLKKAKSKRGSIFTCLIFIEILQELSKHTLYVV
jgi:hypothetical protein